MSEKITGKIIVLKQTVQVTDKFSKRELVVETEEKYPQFIPIQFTQDKCAVLDSFSVGENVEVSVNLGGRLWTSPQGEDKYFLSLTAWKIEKTEISESNQNNILEDVDDDDLPF